MDQDESSPPEQSLPLKGDTGTQGTAIIKPPVKSDTKLLTPADLFGWKNSIEEDLRYKLKVESLEKQIEKLEQRLTEIEKDTSWVRFIRKFFSKKTGLE